MIETYRGHKIKTARKAKDRSGMRSIEVTIDGHYVHRQTYFSGQVDSVTEDLHLTARLYVDASVDRPEAYTWSRSA